MLAISLISVIPDDGFGKKRPSEESYGGERKRAHVDTSDKPFAIKVRITPNVDIFCHS